MPREAAADGVGEPIDPDLEPDTAEHLTSVLGGQAAVVAVVAVGGGIGAAARYGAGLLWPTEPMEFPWTTMMINVVGCLLVGVLLVLIVEVWVAHRLLRPFLGTGALGGFTTFSTYAADVQRLVDVGDARFGWIYLALTPALALISVWVAAAATRRFVRRRAA